MITFYYEIKKQFRETETGFYKVDYDGAPGAAHRHSSTMAYAADRVWEEHEDGNVAFIKNRTLGAGADVDLEEFMWIKLAAKQI